jgi:hypothetical protein
MIWDRFDDAMDDLDDHDDRLHDQIRALERKLRAAGIEPGPWKKPDHRGRHSSFQGPHDTYLDRQSELHAAEARLRDITQVWNAHVARGGGADANPGESSMKAAASAPPPAAAPAAVILAPVAARVSGPEATPDDAEAPVTGASRFVQSWFGMLYVVSVVSAFAIGLLVGLMKR